MRLAQRGASERVTGYMALGVPHYYRKIPVTIEGNPLL